MSSATIQFVFSIAYPPGFYFPILASPNNLLCVCVTSFSCSLVHVFKLRTAYIYCVPLSRSFLFFFSRVPLLRYSSWHVEWHSRVHLKNAKERTHSLARDWSFFDFCFDSYTKLPPFSCLSIEYYH